MFVGPLNCISVFKGNFNGESLQRNAFFRYDSKSLS